MIIIFSLTVLASTLGVVNFYVKVGDTIVHNKSYIQSVKIVHTVRARALKDKPSGSARDEKVDNRALGLRFSLLPKTRGRDRKLDSWELEGCKELLRKAK